MKTISKFHPTQAKVAIINKMKQKSEEMAQCLRAFTALPKDLFVFWYL